MKIILTTALVILCSSFSTAQTSKTTTPQAAVTTEEFRCEKMTGLSLIEFKTKLVESCDLNKPFSSSLSSVLNESTYFYCCQKKK